MVRDNGCKVGIIPTVPVCSCSDKLLSRGAASWLLSASASTNLPKHYLLLLLQFSNRLQPVVVVVLVLVVASLSL